MTATWQRWCWPMPTIGGHEPTISSGFSCDGSGPNRDRRDHWGVDLMYRRHEGDGGPRRTARHPTYTRGWYCPAGVPVLAIGSAKVYAAGWARGRYSVLLDHHDVPGYGPLATWYTHLAEVHVVAGQDVIAGQTIGIVGLSGTDIRHLHFEWRDCSRGRGRRRTVVDPEPWLRRLPPLR